MRIVLHISSKLYSGAKKGVSLKKWFAQLMVVVMATNPVWWCIAMGLASRPVMLVVLRGLEILTNVAWSWPTMHSSLVGEHRLQD